MAKSRKRTRRLTEAYTFPGFRPLAGVRGVFGDPKARLVTLVRRSKKRCAAFADVPIASGTTDARAGCAICPAAMRASTWSWRFGVCAAGVAGP